MTPDLSSLLARVTDFLQPTEPSAGGNAGVTACALQDLGDLFTCLIAAKWKPNEQGELPVEFRLTDRTRYERPVYQPNVRLQIPTLKDSTIDLHMAAATAYGEIASDASRRAASHLSAARTTLVQATAAHGPLDAGGVRWLKKTDALVTPETVDAALAEAFSSLLAQKPAPPLSASSIACDRWGQAFGLEASVVLRAKVSVTRVDVSGQEVTVDGLVPCQDMPFTRTFRLTAKPDLSDTLGVAGT